MRPTIGDATGEAQDSISHDRLKMVEPDAWQRQRQRQLVKHARADERITELRNALDTTTQNIQALHEGLLGADIAAHGAADLAERMESNTEQLQLGWQEILRRSRHWSSGLPAAGFNLVGARHEPGIEERTEARVASGSAEWCPQRPPMQLSLESSSSRAAATSHNLSLPHATHTIVNPGAGTLPGAADLTGGARLKSPPVMTK